MFLSLISLATTLFLTPSCSSGLEDAFSLDYNIYLDEDENFSFHWSIINDTHMEIGIACRNLGWCAVGVSPNGQMPDSDINFFWVDDSTSTVYLQDRYATSRSVPVYDDEQDLTLLSGSQSDNVTYINYIREKFSCDEEDNTIELGTTRLLYAYHPDDPTKELFDSNSVEAHSNKGSKSVNLLNGGGFEVTLPDDVLTVELTMSNYSVPSSETTYHCKLFKLPETQEVQHIVRFEPIVQTGNEGVVHHILVYYCPSDNVEEEDVGFEQTCGIYQNMAVGSADCVYGTASYSWAIGGEGFSFPSNVGLEMSGTNDADGTELQYVLLEIHYDNPDGKTDIIDNSGMKIYYSPTLRQENAGLIEIGIAVNPFHFIAPGIGVTQNTGYCTSGCTTAGLPEDGVKIFSSLLHAHTAGIGLNLRHVRNGVELSPIDQNWNYDFDYQNMIAITNEIDFLPGDDLILDCYYDTSNRDGTTFGGESTQEEMCLVYVYAYPKPNLRECMTVFTLDVLNDWGTYADEQGYLELDQVITGLGINPYAIDYKSNLEGAIYWYQQLWLDTDRFNQRYQVCDDAFGTDLIDPAEVAIPTIDKPYEQQICGNTVGFDISDVDDDDDAVMFINIQYVWITVILTICLLFTNY